MNARADGQFNLDVMSAAAAARTERRLAKRFERSRANDDCTVGHGACAGQAAGRSGRVAAGGKGTPMRDEIAGGMRRGG